MRWSRDTSKYAGHWSLKTWIEKHYSRQTRTEWPITDPLKHKLWFLNALRCLYKQKRLICFIRKYFENLISRSPGLCIIRLMNNYSSISKQRSTRYSTKRHKWNVVLKLLLLFLISWWVLNTGLTSQCSSVQQDKSLLCKNALLMQSTVNTLI